MSNDLYLENQKRATTIVVAVFKDGAIIGADMQCTSSHSLGIYHEKFEKLVKICSKSAAGIAGVPIMINLLKDAKKIIDTWENLYGNEPTPDGQFTILANATIGRGVNHSAFLFACYDDEMSCGRIFHAEPGLITEINSGFDAIGSGAEPLICNLRTNKFKKGLSYEEALKTLRESLRFSHESNAGVGGEFRAYALTKDGVKDISSEMNKKEE